MDIPTRLDIFAIGRDYLRTRAKKLDPAQVDIEGSDANIVVAEASVMGNAVLRQLGYRTSVLLVDSANNEDLDRLLFDRFSMTRKGASSSRTAVQFTRPTFAIGSGTIPIGTLVTTDTGTEFITTSTANFGATDLASAARVRSVQAGSLTSAGANAIVRFSKPDQIFDKSIVVTNAVATAGGDDAEDDPTFRNRARMFWRTARRGTLAAIEFGALAVPGVTSAQASEITSSGGTPARLVQLYVADSSGISNEVLAADVQQSLLEYRAGGIQVLVSTSSPYIPPIRIALQYRANVDTVALRDAVRAALIEFINSLAVNAPLLVADIYTVLTRFTQSGVIVNKDSIVLPVGDLIPSVGQTIRATESSVVIDSI